MDPRVAHRRQRLAVGALVALTLLVAGMIGYSYAETQAAHAWVVRTLEIEGHLVSFRVWINRDTADLLAGVLGVELAGEDLRTGDQMRAHAELAELRELVGADPEQAARIDELSRLLDARHDVQGRAEAAARQGGLEAAREVLASSGWAADRARVRSVTSAMLLDAQRAYREREARYTVEFRRVTLALVAALVLMAGTFVYVVRQARFALDAREEAERAREEARRSALLYAAVARNFPNGAIGLYDRDLRFVLFDGTRVAAGGDPGSRVGRTLAEIVPPDAYHRIVGAHREALEGREGRAEAVIGGRTLEIATRPVRDDGGAVILGIAVSQDVTEERALRTQLAVSSRLASLGTLVAGVAHEVNNPLAGTLASIGIAIDDQGALIDRIRRDDPLDREDLARDGTEVVEALLDAQAGGLRISRIVKDLALFGRPNPMRTRVRLGDVVTSAMRWLPSTVGQVATVHVDDEDAPEVHASGGQLEQVVVNLVANAAFAMPEGRRGDVAIRIFATPDGRAALTVRDDGRGMDAATLERIFDPFFTTREVGQGMGLGLPICHAIVTAHGGTLTATSRPGEGSTFRIELPAADAAA
jgi:C4-dicarboxylate-specific signal transduction histidine kinase